MSTFACQSLDFPARALHQFITAIRTNRIQGSRALATEGAFVATNVSFVICGQGAAALFAFVFHFQRHIPFSSVISCGVLQRNLLSDGTAAVKIRDHGLARTILFQRPSCFAAGLDSCASGRGRPGRITEIAFRAGNAPVAVVYLEGSFPRSSSLPTKQIVQKNLTFVPSLLPVEVGTKVEFPNLDDTYHSIFSYSPAKRFDLGRYRPEERPIPSEVFDKPGLVTLRCDIHEHMRGLILVVETPHFVVSDTDGRFRLGGLPSGRYVLKAWVDSKTTREQPVDLKNRATAHVDFP